MRRTPHLLWSPHKRDVFAIGSGDGQSLKLYQFCEERTSSGDGDGREQSMQLISGVTDVQQLKCMEWCPHMLQPWTFAVGTASGKLVLHDCGPSGLPGGSPSGRPTSALCEFVPRVGPRVCFSTAWNPMQPNQIAAGLDKVRGAFGVLVWDVTRGAAPSGTLGSDCTQQSPSKSPAAACAGFELPGQGMPMPSVRGASCNRLEGNSAVSSSMSFDLSAMGACCATAYAASCLKSESY